VTSRFDKSGKKTLPLTVGQRPRKFASWAIIVALFFNIISAVVFPGLSAAEENAAYPQMQNENVLVICTPNGLKFVSLDENGEPAPAENTDDGYCAFCQPVNHPILPSPAIASVTSGYDYARFQQPVPGKAEQSIASFSLRPLGSRAPPVSSI